VAVGPAIVAGRANIDALVESVVGVCSWFSGSATGSAAPSRNFFIQTE
jgi:hypothetical protein